MPYDWGGKESIAEYVAAMGAGGQAGDVNTWDTHARRASCDMLARELLRRQLVDVGQPQQLAADRLEWANASSDPTGFSNA